MVDYAANLRVFRQMSMNVQKEVEFPAQSPRFSVDQIEAEIARRKAARPATDENPS